MHMIRLMTACLVLTADAQKLTEKKVMDLSGPTRRLQATQELVGNDGQPITLQSIINKVIAIGAKVIFDQSGDKIGRIMKEVVDDILPDVMTMLDAAKPEAIKEVVTSVLGDADFEKAVEEVLKEPKVTIAASKIFDSLLASPSLKDIAEKACKVVSGDEIADVVSRRLQGGKLDIASMFKGLFGSQGEDGEQQMLFDKIVKQLTEIGSQFFFGGKDDKYKVQKALKEVLKILPDAIKLVEKMDPTIITNAVESFLQDESFLNTVGDFLKEHSATAKKVVDALLEIEPIKNQAVGVCDAVKGKTSSKKLFTDIVNQYDPSTTSVYTTPP